MACRSTSAGVFQLTLPIRGAIQMCAALTRVSTISTHAPHTGSDLLQRFARAGPTISTHAPHTGSDCPVDDADAIRQAFQLTLPIRGAMPSLLKVPTTSKFQLTLPIRGAMTVTFDGYVTLEFQLTLPIRGAIELPRQGSGRRLISTHAPHTGSDSPLLSGFPDIRISTHAPHTGSDNTVCRFKAVSCHFNSRSPYGERYASNRRIDVIWIFQLTLPIRGAIRIWRRL